MEYDELVWALREARSILYNRGHYEVADRLVEVERELVKTRRVIDSIYKALDKAQQENEHEN